MMLSPAFLHRPRGSLWRRSHRAEDGRRVPLGSVLREELTCLRIHSGASGLQSLFAAGHTGVAGCSRLLRSGARLAALFQRGHEADEDQMGKQPAWQPGLVLRAHLSSNKLERVSITLGIINEMPGRLFFLEGR